MIRGSITCSCGQLFGFETQKEMVACPKCKVGYISIQHGAVEPPEIIEEPQSEVTENGTDI